MEIIDYNSMDPLEFVEIIDTKYYDAKEKKLSRLSIEWGKWSREMNLVLRERIEELDPKANMCVQFKMVFVYWVARSKLLELHFKGNRILSKMKKKALVKELKQYRQIIEDPSSLKDDLGDSFADLVLQRGNL